MKKILGARASEQRINENKHRHLYRRWAELMATESWELDRHNAPAYEPDRKCPSQSP